MYQSDPYTTHNSSPEMSEDEDDVDWDDDELNTLVDAVPTTGPAGPSTSTAIYSGNHSLPTGSDSSLPSSFNQTPPSSKKKKKAQKKVSKPASGGKNKEFTPKMRDRQARGNDMLSTESDDSSDGGFNTRRKPYESTETWESKQRRRIAATILNNPEFLMMHAEARNDSISGTRYHFTQILCGYNDPEDHYPFTKSLAEEEKERKGKSKGGKKKTWAKNALLYPDSTAGQGGQQDVQAMQED